MIACKKIEVVEIKKLRINERNARLHSDDQIRQLMKSIEKFGFTVPILIDEKKMVIAGHGRLEALKRLGHRKAPAILLNHLTENEKRAYVLADNQIPMLADWDLTLLKEELDFLNQEGFELEDIGFGNEEVQNIFETEEKEWKKGLTNENDIPDPPSKPKTKLGDIYQLGSHRLMCGDATNTGQVEKLLGGLKPVLMVTDPPYGVNYEPEWRNEAAEKGKIAYAARALGKVENDDRVDWTEAIRLFDGDVAYVWHAGVYAAQVADSLMRAGYEIRSQIIWAKQGLVISRGHYHWQHEPCWYAVKKGKTGHWSGDRKQTTLWQIANRNPRGGEIEDANTDHRTQKPVECMRRPIVNNTKRGESVYDPFLGSGTSLIAAESTGRVCYGMEIDPRYCDMIVKRWEDFVGKKAQYA
ncbi:MAG: DNA methylase [Deltaproteobacteria bacterium GWA2_45_12]|nr:MAG: DNA methylase [Deltaproteobacteria bacterium GWA2_45_12]